MKQAISSILILCLCCLPHSVQAASCSSFPSFGTPGKQYTSGTVEVPRGCTLRLRAGVHIAFKPGSYLRVLGTLEVLGERGSEVVLMAEQPSLGWGGLVGYPTSEVGIQHLRLEGSTMGVWLENPPSLFRSVHLLNNFQSSVRVGAPTFTFTEKSTYQDIWIEERSQSAAPEKTGLTILGLQVQVVVDSLHVQTVGRGEGRVEVLGTQQDVVFNAVTFSGCSTVVRHQYQTSYAILPDPACSTSEVPVLFIPGYGTSLALPEMLNPPSPEVTIRGLHFVKYLTPGYFDFLAALREANVIHSVAYYDWRQPAETILTRYILPAISDLKRRTGSRYITIVGHSYGGILARQYIQGSSYLGDVHKLVQVGSPNQGAVKAYPVWQAGVFPADWAAVGSLVRFYGKELPKSPERDHEVIHRYFPSVQDLQPTYPALKRGKSFLNAGNLTYANTRLLLLNASVALLTKRVSVATVVSATEDTPTWALVQPVKEGRLWPDGELLGDTTKLSQGGDGTVPTQSAILTGAGMITGVGGHQNLPGTAALSILQYLTAPVTALSPQPTAYKRVTLFSIDCPVAVTITGPDGFRVHTSSHQVQPGTGEGMVMATEDLQWFWLPELPAGQVYTVTITALADTPVRYWYENQDIHELRMVEGQVHEVTLTERQPESEKESNPGTVSFQEHQDYQSGYTFPFVAHSLASVSLQLAPPVQAVREGKEVSLRLTRDTRVVTTVIAHKKRIVRALWAVSLLSPVAGAMLHYLLRRE